MNLYQLVARLEQEWDLGGTLGNIREGIFTPEAGNTFLSFLNEIQLDDEMIPKRLLSLLWYLPIFLEWQRERVAEKSENDGSYDGFITSVLNTLEEVLGMP